MPRPATGHAGRRPVADQGASAVEHGLIVAAVVGLIVAIVFAYTRTTGGIFFGSCETFGEVESTLDCRPTETQQPSASQQP